MTYPVMTAKDLREGVYDNLITMVRALLPHIPDCGQILMCKDVTDASDVFFETKLTSRELRKLSRENVPESIVDAEVGCACPFSLSCMDGKPVIRAYDITEAIREVINEVL